MNDNDLIKSAAEKMYVAIQRCRRGIGREANYLSSYAQTVSGLRDALAEYEAATNKKNHD